MYFPLQINSTAIFVYCEERNMTGDTDTVMMSPLELSEYRKLGNVRMRIMRYNISICWFGVSISPGKKRKKGVCVIEREQT